MFSKPKVLKGANYANANPNALVPTHTSGEEAKNAIESVATADNHNLDRAVVGREIARAALKRYTAAEMNDLRNRLPTGIAMYDSAIAIGNSMGIFNANGNNDFSNWYSDLCVMHALFGSGYKRLLADCTASPRDAQVKIDLYNSCIKEYFSPNVAAVKVHEYDNNADKARITLTLQKLRLAAAWTLAGENDISAANARNAEVHPFNFKLMDIYGTHQWLKGLTHALRTGGTREYHTYIGPEGTQPGQGLYNYHYMVQVSQGEYIFGFTAPGDRTVLVPVMNAAAIAPELIDRCCDQLRIAIMYLAICGIFVQCYYINGNNPDATGSAYKKYSAAVTKAASRDRALEYALTLFKTNKTFRVNMLYRLEWAKIVGGQLDEFYASDAELDAEMNNIVGRGGALRRAAGQTNVNVPFTVDAGITQMIDGLGEDFHQAMHANDVTVPIAINAAGDSVVVAPYDAQGQTEQPADNWNTL